MTYYLAGALSGLFIRMYTESQAGKAVDDFNLSTARIFVTPFISGLAAVGGILLLATLTLTLTQSSSNTSAATAIADAFNLKNNGLGIVLATIFGYAPNLFINTLQQRAQDVTTELQNTTPQSQGASTSRTAAHLATTPAALTFSSVVGQPNPQTKPIMITNSGGDTIVWQATATTTGGGAWLSVDQATGSISAKQTGSINVNTAVITGLLTGTYTGTISITGTDSSGKSVAGSPQSILVTFTVSPPSCTITAAPAALTFAGVVGQPDPPQQSATITASGACASPVNWSTTIDITPVGGTWLTLTPTSGSTPAGASSQLTFAVDTTGLDPNAYNATVTITPSSGSPATVTVALTVNPAQPPMPQP